MDTATGRTISGGYAWLKQLCPECKAGIGVRCTRPTVIGRRILRGSSHPKRNPLAYPHLHPKEPSNLTTARGRIGGRARRGRPPAL